MNKKLIIILQVCLLLGTSCMTTEEKSAEGEKSVEKKPIEDSLLLSLVLNRSYEEDRYAVLAPQTGLDHSVIKEPKVQEGGYTVVASQTSLERLLIDESKTFEQTKRYILENIKIDKYDISRLVDLLFERNKIPLRLSLKSSPKDGYIIDYDGKYKKYFEKDGGGWEKLYKENPKADGWITVSLPAYDRKTNIFLVYIGTQRHGLSGSGWVIAYKYKNGKLKELTRVMLWIS
jgi:hypothetical protein